MKLSRSIQSNPIQSKWFFLRLSPCPQHIFRQLALVAVEAGIFTGNFMGAGAGAERSMAEGSKRLFIGANWYLGPVLVLWIGWKLCHSEEL